MAAQNSTIAVQSVEEIQTAVRHATRIVPCGGASKPALSNPGQQVTRLDLRSLSGILEYLPGEYTFTAYAGTPLIEIEAALAENGQYLPFDPPLVKQSATLGGTVAAGLSGSGRYRYGGVRDFLMGVRFVDGQGRFARGGGKVVKNAAGFDLPKLMVGSLGRLGILVELTFKVFPRPQTFATATHQYTELSDAINAMHQVADSRMDIHALDIHVDAAHERPIYTLAVRLGGLTPVMHQRLEQVRTILGGGDQLTGHDEDAYWLSAREFSWVPADFSIVKVPTTLAQLPALEQHLAALPVLRRYTVGGNLTWLAWPGEIAKLHEVLRIVNLSGLVLRGVVKDPLIGVPVHSVFSQRIKQALDPASKFLDL